MARDFAQAHGDQDLAGLESHADFGTARLIGDNYPQIVGKEHIAENARREIAWERTSKWPCWFPWLVGP